MTDIVQRVGIEREKEVVFEALSGATFLTTWWSHEGSEERSEPVTLYCEGADANLKLMRREEHSELAWLCTAGPRDWVGTTITVSLHPDDGRTVLQLVHDGWKHRYEASVRECASLWAMCLLSFKSWVEHEITGSLEAMPPATFTASTAGCPPTR